MITVRKPTGVSKAPAGTIVVHEDGEIGIVLSNEYGGEVAWVGLYLDDDTPGALFTTEQDGEVAAAEQVPYTSEARMRYAKPGGRRNDGREGC